MQLLGYAIQGQQNANQEGGDSGFGTKQSFKNVADPFNWRGQSSSNSVFGNIVDPGNVWGMNPNMAAHKNMGLPPPIGNIHPFMYDPNSFVNRPQGHGMYNQMANQLAGQMYSPQVLNPHGMGMQPNKGPSIPFGGMYNGMEPGDPNLHNLNLHGGKGAKGTTHPGYTTMMQHGGADKRRK